MFFHTMNAPESSRHLPDAAENFPRWYQVTAIMMYSTVRPYSRIRFTASLERPR